MARYKLMANDNDGEGEYEIGGQRKNTKKDIEQWIIDNVNACGLDWRVGFTLKLRDSGAVYTWRWIKNNESVNS
jgi:hypothetical protein